MWRAGGHRLHAAAVWYRGADVLGAGSVERWGRGRRRRQQSGRAMQLPMISDD